MEISNTQTGLTVYQKKPEFGGSKLRVENYQSKNNKTDFLVEKDSSIWVNGNAIEANGTNLKDKL